MQIRLDQVREEPFSWQRMESVSAAFLEAPEVVAIGPVEWRGKVVWTDPGFHFRAWLAYEQTLVCDRCLGEFSQPVTTKVELLILVEPSSAGAAEHQLRQEELGVLSVEDELLDTMPLLVEQIQLGVPMKPLCRPDCAGLCPRCGADLNRAACGCEEAPADPRWAALAALRDELPPPGGGGGAD